MKCVEQIEILPHIVDEVRGQCPVFVDGGFSQGTDVFKALALGANLVSKLGCSLFKSYIRCYESFIC